MTSFLELARLAVVVCAASCAVSNPAPITSSNAGTPRVDSKVPEPEWVFSASRREESYQGCNLMHRFLGRPSGLVMLITIGAVEGGELVFFEKELAEHARGAVRLSFDGADALDFVVQFNHTAGAIFFKKPEFADLNARMAASTKMNIEYPDWPDEQPIVLTLPSEALRQTWLKCGETTHGR